MDDLDKKLRETLETLIRDGKFVSSKEFLIYITEHFDAEHDATPMTVRLNEAETAIKQAFIEAGWVIGGTATEINGRVHIANGVDPIKRYDGAALMTREEWEQQAIKEARS